MQSALAQVQWQLSDITAQLAAERGERTRLVACLAALAGDLQRRDPALGRLSATCSQLPDTNTIANIGVSGAYMAADASALPCVSHVCAPCSLLLTGGDAPSKTCSDLPTELHERSCEASDLVVLLHRGGDRGSR